jgi:hypothetical protein
VIRSQEVSREAVAGASLVGTGVIYNVQLSEFAKWEGQGLFNSAVVDSGKPLSPKSCRSGLKLPTSKYNSFQCEALPD